MTENPKENYGIDKIIERHDAEIRAIIRDVCNYANVSVCAYKIIHRKEKMFWSDMTQGSYSYNMIHLSDASFSKKYSYRGNNWKYMLFHELAHHIDHRRNFRLDDQRKKEADQKIKSRQQWAFTEDRQKSVRDHDKMYCDILFDILEFYGDPKLILMFGSDTYDNPHIRRIKSSHKFKIWSTEGKKRSRHINPHDKEIMTYDKENRKNWY